MSKIAGLEEYRGITENDGTATISNGQTSVTFDHGLIGTAYVVTLGAMHSEVADAEWFVPSHTQVTISVSAAVTGDREISWHARYFPDKPHKYKIPLTELVFIKTCGTECISAITIAFRQLYESTMLFDSLTTIKWLVRQLQEQTTYDDSLIRTLVGFRTLQELAMYDDSISVMLAPHSAELQELIGLDDSIVTVKWAVRQLQEHLITDDSVNVTLAPHLAELQEFMELMDNISVRSASVKALQEGLGFGDGVSATRIP